MEEKLQDGELSDEELAEITGGRKVKRPRTGIWGRCGDPHYDNPEQIMGRYTPTEGKLGRHEG